jgi:hypothetical protein
MRGLAPCFALVLLGASGSVVRASPAQSIIGGNPSGATDYPATGMLITELDGGSIVDCTATLIAPDVVLTAAHCVPTPYTGRGLAFSLDPDARDGYGDLVPVIVAHAHPDYHPDRTDTVDLTNAADIAVLILETPITSVMPEQIDGVLDYANVRGGMELEVVGYGVTKFNSSDPSGVKEQGVVTVDRTEAFELDTSNAGPQPCYGDSGGPLFTTGDAPRRMVGVVSRAHGAITTCNSGAIVTRVMPYVNWIFQAAADRTNHGQASGDCSAGGGGLGLALAAVWPLVLRRRRGLSRAPIRGNDVR